MTNEKNPYCKSLFPRWFSPNEPRVYGPSYGNGWLISSLAKRAKFESEILENLYTSSHSNLGYGKPWIDPMVKTKNNFIFFVSESLTIENVCWFTVRPNKVNIWASGWARFITFRNDIMKFCHKTCCRKGIKRYLLW